MINCKVYPPAQSPDASPPFWLHSGEVRHVPLRKDAPPVVVPTVLAALLKNHNFKNKISKHEPTF